MNATIRKFGWPDTLLAEHAHWLVLVRPAQPTLGSLVVAARDEATAFADLPPAAFAELGTVVGQVEATLRAAVGYDQLNWLMLMMVDPHVHFHVIPRYDGERAGAGLVVRDAGWPGQPALAQAVTPDAGGLAALRDWLREHLPG